MKPRSLFLLVCAAACCGLVLLLGNCVLAAPVDPLPKLADLQLERADAVLLPGSTEQVVHMLFAGPAPSVRGHIRRLHSRTTCEIDDSALPYVYYEGREPRAGQHLRVRWVARACRPYPDEIMVLAVSLREATPADLSQFGHTGCWLMVHLDHLLMAQPGSILTSPEPGVLELDWVLPREFIGLTWFAQALVVTSATASGWAVSPGLEFTIGSAL